MKLLSILVQTAWSPKLYMFLYQCKIAQQHRISVLDSSFEHL